ncbi:MAG: hypothetical protein AB1758_34070, partial [Candidatus Eremiobacterota bacterium]
MGCTHLFQHMTTHMACPACLRSQTSGSTCPSCRIHLVPYYVEPESAPRRQPSGQHVEGFRYIVAAFLDGRVGVEQLDQVLHGLRVRFDRFQERHA